ncbi:hypothetical protein JZ751_017099, partial [Albula glossodonta]
MPSGSLSQAAEAGLDSHGIVMDRTGANAHGENAGAGGGATSEKHSALLSTLPRSLPPSESLSHLVCLVQGFGQSVGVWYAQGLEVSVGKVHFVHAVNGSTVLLPCTYSSCIGIKNLYFRWDKNDNGTMIKVRGGHNQPELGEGQPHWCLYGSVELVLCDAVIPAEGVEPHMRTYHERVEFVGTSKSNNISILLWNITFEDEGEYICFARNPKEKNRNHSARFTLYVVDELKVVDNTVTVIIVSIVGGIIGFLIFAMVLKALIFFVLGKVQEK